jgi:hypothetical protein
MSVSIRNSVHGCFRFCYGPLLTHAAGYMCVICTIGGVFLYYQFGLFLFSGVAAYSSRDWCV